MRRRAHKDVPDNFIDRVFAVMALCPQHQFLVLTKRPERMAKYLGDSFLHQRFKQGSQANWKNFKDFDSFPDDLKISEFPQTKVNQ